MRSFPERGLSELMDQIFEYAANHPFLFSAAVLMTLVALANEVRLRTQGVAALGADDAIRLLNSSGGVVIDVRNPEQYAKSHIVNAKNIPLDQMTNKLDTLKKFKQKPVVAYCDTGTTSGKAAAMLRSAGYDKVYQLRGGLTAWQRDNRPVVTEGANDS